jgi:hypothetical protein
MELPPPARASAFMVATVMLATMATVASASVHIVVCFISSPPY